MQDKYISVSQLTKYMKYKIDTDENLGHVFLKGEISNFKAHSRGHYYFTLKDEFSRINAVMFSSSASKCPFIPQDGMKVLVTGKISIYEATGGYQIYVNTMTEDGVGNLYIAFEQLKEKLQKEGLFDPKYKKPIPKYPKTIGIITAPTGAAIRDILSTIKRRWPIAETILFPSLVQGASAASDIVRQIELASNYPLDLLIVGRGGGSIEDMWCFNDENVARSLFSCKVPVISAVGHEIDYTISDFVADLRAPTPTGAAEMGVPNQTDVLSYIRQLQLRLQKVMLNIIDTNYKKVLEIKERYVLKNPISMYQIKEQKFDTLLDRVMISMDQLLKHNRERLNKSLTNYFFQNPSKIYEYKLNNFLQIKKSLFKDMVIYLDKTGLKYNAIISKLETLNPLLTMKRGYTITKNKGKVISSVSNVKVKDKLEIQFHDGEVQVEVVGR